ncbi:MAG TPA: hypothetical protein VLX92_05890 [Kofleriaceae bacterium]|nr:hypothetical protein [Kofleriaceae bacterium]
MLRSCAPLALLALLACDAGRAPRLGTVPRATLDLRDMPVPLPRHGLAVQTFAMSGYSDTEVLDSDTMRVVVDEWDPKQGHLHLDKTVTLSAADRDRLAALAERAWREVPHGKMPDVTDMRQDLYILDRDDAFYLTNSLIGDEHGPTARPIASELVLAVKQLASPLLEGPLPPAR